MIEYLDVRFIPNLSHPEQPDKTAIALEAGCSADQAEAFVQAAWEQVETFTGRCYRGIASGEVLVRAHYPHEYRWPRYPFPATITAEIWSDQDKGWRAVEVVYRAGYVELYAGNLYRLTQAPTPPVDPLPGHVVQAVSNLAIYQLIQQPQRREFRSQTMGETTLTREAVMGALYGSGAGALLAGEVRK